MALASLLWRQNNTLSNANAFAFAYASAIFILFTLVIFHAFSSTGMECQIHMQIKDAQQSSNSRPLLSMSFIDIVVDDEDDDDGGGGGPAVGSDGRRKQRRSKRAVSQFKTIDTTDDGTGFDGDTELNVSWVRKGLYRSTRFISSLWERAMGHSDES